MEILKNFDFVNLASGATVSQTYNIPSGYNKIVMVIPHVGNTIKYDLSVAGDVEPFFSLHGDQSTISQVNFFRTFEKDTVIQVKATNGTGGVLTGAIAILFKKAG